MIYSLSWVSGLGSRVMFCFLFLFFLLLRLQVVSLLYSPGTDERSRSRRVVQRYHRLELYDIELYDMSSYDCQRGLLNRVCFLS